MSNQSEKLGLALIVSGPSGAGKSTVCELLRQKHPELHFSVSCTTRAPRPGEIDRKDYCFLTSDEFAVKVAANEFIEYASVHGNSYGTLRSEIVDQVANGNDVLLDIDVQGALQIREYIKDDELMAKCVEFAFIGPPDFLELERRLRSRGTEDEDTVQLRLQNAMDELNKWQEYDFLIINKDLDQTVKDMENLIDILHKSTKRMKKSGFFA